VVGFPSRIQVESCRLKAAHANLPKAVRIFPAEVKAMLLEQCTRLLHNRLPKVISPRMHSMIGYAVVAAGFFAVAGAAWKNHRKAAAVSLACGIAQMLNVFLTDMPGGVFKVIDFPTHGRIERGLSAVCTALPNLMEFNKGWPAWFFRAQALTIAASAGMTDFKSAERSVSRFRRAA
jgi:hypothetical protein